MSEERWVWLLGGLAAVAAVALMYWFQTGEGTGITTFGDGTVGTIAEWVVFTPAIALVLFGFGAFAFTILHGIYESIRQYLASRERAARWRAEAEAEAARAESDARSARHLDQLSRRENRHREANEKLEEGNRDLREKLALAEERLGNLRILAADEKAYDKLRKATTLSLEELLALAERAETVVWSQGYAPDLHYQIWSPGEYVVIDGAKYRADDDAFTFWWRRVK